jgi:metal-responsive CopG/Arc/MetJ family transcriptional regulator
LGIVETISITIDQKLLRAIDRAVRATRRTRSDVVRSALTEWLERQRLKRMAAEDRAGYQSRPVTIDEFGDLITAAAAVTREDDE